MQLKFSVSSKKMKRQLRSCRSIQRMERHFKVCFKEWLESEYGMKSIN